MEKTLNNMKTALVLTGGYCNISLIKDVIPETADIVIAADSGYNTAVALGITPDIVMGDFDSYKGKLPEELEILRVACEKDVTDTMLACEYAKDSGCRYITIVGGTGGRIDHSISNIFYLEDLRSQGIRVKLTDGENTVQVIMDETVSVPNDGGYFSVFALDKCVITESDCKYPLNRASLERRRPYGVSNEAISDQAKVTVEGVALLVTSKR